MTDDVAPVGYIAWHEWAARQHKAGHRQRVCCMCRKFKFPCELSERVIVGEAITSSGRKVRTESPLCKACDAAAVSR
jgi:hypothetical protein